MKFLLLTAALALSSCSVTVPAVAKLEKGEVFMGSITATLTTGSYSLHSLEGKTIEGTYKPETMSTGRIFSFNISDGRSGSVMINSINEVSGYGLGKLNTGEKCKITYGQGSVVNEL